MAKMKWGETGVKRFFTGCDWGALYVMDDTGVYGNGVAWNGLISVAISPSGAEANKQYADNGVYADIRSEEECSGTIECFNTPDEFDICDGILALEGVSLGQQIRRKFGFAYRSKVGNDVKGLDYGYKIKVVYNATASPSDQTDETTNESPEAQTLSYEFDTEKVSFTYANKVYKVATLEFDSTKLSQAQMKAVEDLLYGTDNAEPTLPAPEVLLAAVKSAAA